MNRLVRLRKVEQRADPRGVEIAGDRPPGRAEQVEPRLGADDEAAEERGVEPLDVFERVHHGKPRLGAKEDRRVAARHVEVDQERRARLGLGQRRRGVHGNSRCADAPLRADDRQRCRPAPPA